jgi:hypothetical protein
MPIICLPPPPQILCEAFCKHNEKRKSMAHWLPNPLSELLQHFVQKPLIKLSREECGALRTILGLHFTSEPK